MEWFANLPLEWQKFLLGTLGKATGGVVAKFAGALLQVGGRRVRDAFQTPERTQALHNAIAASLNAALDEWAIDDIENVHYRDLFCAWLVEPAVVSQFRLLLTPSEHSELDLGLLREEFEALDLSAEHLGKVNFDVLIQDMIGAFYITAAEESALQEPLKIGLLRQMAERMGALQHLAERQVVASEQGTNLLGQIRQLAEEGVSEQSDTNELLQKILQVLTEATQPDSSVEMLVAFQQSELALSKVGLPTEVVDAPEANGTSRHMLPALVEPIHNILRDIRAQLTEASVGPSDEALARLETHYRQTIIDQFEKLTFKGLSPSGTPIVMPLEQIYVELKAVADVPEAADTYSADERRLLLEAEERGAISRDELALHLDALRAERWNRQTRQEVVHLQRRSIQETLDDRTQRGVVILGDPGSGKSTLLHHQALRAARADGAIVPQPLPIFVPLAAYDDYGRHVQERGSLGDFLAVYYDRWHSLPGLAPLFQRVLTAGRALVLLDGLDEVLDTTTRQFVAEQAGALIRQWAPHGNRFAVTSRIVGYREARLPGDLPHVTVLDFGRREIEIFTHQWCRSYEFWVAGSETATARHLAAIEEQALLEDVRSNPSVERLASSPLLLTMLAAAAPPGGQAARSAYRVV